MRKRQGASRRGRGRSAAARTARLTTLRRVDVCVKEDGRRGVDGAQRAEDVGVLPAGLRRRRDVPVRRARRVQVHRPEGGDAQRVVAARLQPCCGGQRGGAARVSGAAANARSGASSGGRSPVAGWRRPGVRQRAGGWPRTTAFADCLSRAGGLELGALDNVSRVVVRDGDDEGGAAALQGRVHGGHASGWSRPVAISSVGVRSALYFALKKAGGVCPV